MWFVIPSSTFFNLFVLICKFLRKLYLSFSIFFSLFLNWISCYVSSLFLGIVSCPVFCPIYHFQFHQWLLSAEILSSFVGTNVLSFSLRFWVLLVIFPSCEMLFYFPEGLLWGLFILLTWSGRALYLSIFHFGISNMLLFEFQLIFMWYVWFYIFWSVGIHVTLWHLLCGKVISQITKLFSQQNSINFYPLSLFVHKPCWLITLSAHLFWHLSLAFRSNINMIISSLCFSLPLIVHFFLIFSCCVGPCVVTLINNNFSNWYF